jgi:ADP-ribosylglycohydrolase
MTSAIAGACYGVDVIPMRWIEAVENREYLERPAKELLEVK